MFENSLFFNQKKGEKILYFEEGKKKGNKLVTEIKVHLLHLPDP